MTTFQIVSLLLLVASALWFWWEVRHAPDPPPERPENLMHSAYRECDADVIGEDEEEHESGLLL